MEKFKNKFLVVTFVDNSTPPETFIEPVPWKWVTDSFVYYPSKTKLCRKKSNVNSTPNYNDANSWDKCQLINVKGMHYKLLIFFISCCRIFLRSKYKWLIFDVIYI